MYGFKRPLMLISSQYLKYNLVGLCCEFWMNQALLFHNMCLERGKLENSPAQAGSIFFVDPNTSSYGCGFSTKGTFSRALFLLQ